MTKTIPGKKPERDSLYDRVFTPEERELLHGRRHLRLEQDLLRTKVLRLARLTPLKRLNDRELNALLKLLRLIAQIDALERTQLMARKSGDPDDPFLQALDALDPDDL
jgi:hypothetical protein